jgi:hypothetical protein
MKYFIKGAALEVMVFPLDRGVTEEGRRRFFLLLVDGALSELISRPGRAPGAGSANLQRH